MYIFIDGDGERQFLIFISLSARAHTHTHFWNQEEFSKNTRKDCLQLKYTREFHENKQTPPLTLIWCEHRESLKCLIGGERSAADCLDEIRNELKSFKTRWRRAMRNQQLSIGKSTLNSHRRLTLPTQIHLTIKLSKGLNSRTIAIVSWYKISIFLFKLYPLNYLPTKLSFALLQQLLSWQQRKHIPWGTSQRDFNDTYLSANYKSKFLTYRIPQMRTNSFGPLSGFPQGKPQAIA